MIDEGTAADLGDAFELMSYRSCTTRSLRRVLVSGQTTILRPVT